ncbi:hypothetical protein V2J09_021194 [Rumex salicifolius]
MDKSINKDNKSRRLQLRAQHSSRQEQSRAKQHNTATKRGQLPPSQQQQNTGAKKVAPTLPK